MKKMFMSLFLGIFLISFVSAWDWDNTYNYLEETDEVIIENAFGLGRDLAYLKLTWGDTTVPRGIDVHVGTFNLTLLSDNSTEIFDSLDLENLKNGQTLTRGKQYKVKTYKMEDSYITECVNVSPVNNSLICESVEDGKKQVVEWVPLSNPNLNFIQNVEYEIGVFVDVEKDDYVDWVPSLFGVSIVEWSYFSESIDVDMYGYWKFEDSSSPAVDELGNLTSSVSGVTFQQTGYVDYGYSFDGSNDAISLGSQSFSAITVCTWHLDDDADKGEMIFSKDAVSPRGIMMGFSGADEHLYFYDGDSSVEPANPVFLNDSTWYHICFTHTGSNASIYIDGKHNVSGTSTLNTGASPTYIGSWRGTGGSYSGNLDEMVLWNRALSTSEISEVYDSYTSCTESLINTSWSSWTNTESCQTNDTITQNRSLLQYDENNCGETANTTYWEFQESSCNYCSYSLVNTSWTSWVDTESCQTNDFLTQNRSLIEYDTNWATCYDVTGIASDLWNSGINKTHWDYQEDACNYCSYSVTNTSWTSWVDTESCQINDFLTQNRSLIEYDTNWATCYDVTGIASDLWNSGDNNTHWDYQEDACNYCSYSVVNSSWSSWVDTESCQPNDFKTQNRSLFSYDENYSSCYLVTSLGSDLWNSGVNLTYWDYQEAACDYCTPSLTNTSWSSWANETICLENNTVQQSRNLVQYDENFCGEVSNITFYEYQEDSCTFVPCVNNIVNSSWSSWINTSSCGENNLTSQSRFLIEYDANSSICNNWTNVTHYDYQNVACVYVAPVISSDERFGYVVDFEKDYNLYLLLISFIFAGVLFFFKQYKWSALVLFVDFALMFLSGINWIFSGIVLICSVIVAGRATS